MAAAPANTAGQDMMDDLKKYMKEQLSDLKNDVKTDINLAVNKIASQVSNNTENIAQLQRDMDSKIERAVAVSVSRELKKQGPRGQNLLSTNNDAYWRSRRSVRCWPIKGPNSDLWGLTGDFLIQVLGIAPSDLPQECVESVRRVSTPRTNRPQKIRNEVIVTFREVATRDMVFSFAPNLANFRQSTEPPGIRLDYPDQLRGPFSTLEKYGALLKSELGPAFKRSIKYDDAVMSLRIDVLFPGDERWTQIPLEIAAEELEKRKKNESAATRQRLSSISSSQNQTLTRLPEPVQGSSRDVVFQTSSSLSRHTAQPPARWGERV